MYVNDQPSGGETTVGAVRVLHGDAQQRTFAGWIDSNVPLMYSVAIRDVETGFETRVQFRAARAVVTFKLPIMGNITLAADVYDLYGSKASTVIVVEALSAIYGQFCVGRPGDCARHRRLQRSAFVASAKTRMLRPKAAPLLRPTAQLWTTPPTVF